MIIYVDIDLTICHTIGSDYENSKPIKENIKKINALYDNGNHITIWSARGRRSGINHFNLTYSQLEKWKVKYHVLDLNSKPDFDLIIDDKSKRIEEI